MVSDYIYIKKLLSHISSKKITLHHILITKAEYLQQKRRKNKTKKESYTKINRQTFERRTETKAHIYKYAFVS